MVLEILGNEIIKNFFRKKIFFLIYYVYIGEDTMQKKKEISSHLQINIGSGKNGRTY